MNRPTCEHGGNGGCSNLVTHVVTFITMRSRLTCKDHLERWGQRPYWVSELKGLLQPDSGSAVAAEPDSVCPECDSRFAPFPGGTCLQCQIGWENSKRQNAAASPGAWQSNERRGL